MSRALTTIERAYQLAATGTFGKVADIARQLNKEGFEGTHALFSGLAFKRDLKKVMQASETDSRAAT